VVMSSVATVLHGGKVAPAASVAPAAEPDNDLESMAA